MKGKNNYEGKTGETVLISPPNSDNEDGYVYDEYQILWQNNIFILYGKENCWPNLEKKEHIHIKQLTDEITPLENKIDEAATNWVMKDDKWSNNNDEGGDNYGSFVAGAKWGLNYPSDPLDKHFIFSICSTCDEPTGIIEPCTVLGSNNFPGTNFHGELSFEETEKLRDKLIQSLIDDGKLEEANDIKNNTRVMRILFK